MIKSFIFLSTSLETRNCIDSDIQRGMIYGFIRVLSWLNALQRRENAVSYMSKLAHFMFPDGAVRDWYGKIMFLRL